MLIRNTNLRRIVSLLFALCLLFCLVPTAAFALDENTGNLDYTDEDIVTNTGSIDRNDHTIKTNQGKVWYNYGDIETNDKADIDYDSYSADSGGYVVSNYDRIEVNKGLVNTNCVDAIVETNFGTVAYNNNIVGTNYGTVVRNNGTVEINEGTVESNYGSVDSIVEVNCGTVNGGTVKYNCGGTVVEGGTVINQCYSVSFVDSKDRALRTSVNCGNYVHNHDESVDGELDDSEYIVDARFTYWVVEGTAFLLELKDGYEPYITNGSGAVKSLGNNKYAISSSGGNIELELRPISAGSVPATADMSNVPLWSALLLVFAATAVLTRKKKNG